MGKFTWMSPNPFWGASKEETMHLFPPICHCHGVRIEAEADEDDINSIIIVLPRYCQGTIRVLCFLSKLGFCRLWRKDSIFVR